MKDRELFYLCETKPPVAASADPESTAFVHRLVMLANSASDKVAAAKGVSVTAREGQK